MRTASIIAMMMQHAPLKRRYTCTRLHGAILQRAVIFIQVAVTTSMGRAVSSLLKGLKC
jgi:hypothetical protein